MPVSRLRGTGIVVIEKLLFVYLSDVVATTQISNLT